MSELLNFKEFPAYSFARSVCMKLRNHCVYTAQRSHMMWSLSQRSCAGVILFLYADNLNTPRPSSCLNSMINRYRFALTDLTVLERLRLSLFLLTDISFLFVFSVLFWQIYSLLVLYRAHYTPKRTITLAIDNEGMEMNQVPNDFVHPEVEVTSFWRLRKRLSRIRVCTSRSFVSSRIYIQNRYPERPIMGCVSQQLAITV